MFFESILFGKYFVALVTGITLHYGQGDKRRNKILYP